MPVYPGANQPCRLLPNDADVSIAPPKLQWQLGKFHWRDFHPLERQLASLQSQNGTTGAFRSHPDPRAAIGQEVWRQFQAEAAKSVSNCTACSDPMRQTGGLSHYVI